MGCTKTTSTDLALTTSRMNPDCLFTSRSHETSVGMVFVPSFFQVHAKISRAPFPQRHHLCTRSSLDIQAIRATNPAKLHFLVEGDWDSSSIWHWSSRRNWLGWKTATTPGKKNIGNLTNRCWGVLSLSRQKQSKCIPLMCDYNIRSRLGRGIIKGSRPRNHRCSVNSPGPPNTINFTIDTSPSTHHHNGNSDFFSLSSFLFLTFRRIARGGQQVWVEGKEQDGRTTNYHDLHHRPAQIHSVDTSPVVLLPPSKLSQKCSVYQWRGNITGDSLWGFLVWLLLSWHCMDARANRPPWWRDANTGSGPLAKTPFSNHSLNHLSFS